MACPTLRSEGVNPSFSLLVLSANRANTPLPPTLAILGKFAGRSSGVKSNLKSPVCTTAPYGVSTTIPYASGILCVVRKKCTAKC
ncbi:hypothetical protein D3C77_390110 [compost metagenome]